MTQAIPFESRGMPERVRIGCSTVDAVTYEEALDRLVELAEARSTAAHIVTPNAQHVVLLEKDPYLRKIYSDLITSEFRIGGSMSASQAIPFKSMVNPERVRIGRSNVDSVTYEEALDRLVELAEARSGTAQVVTPNAQHVVLLEKDPHLRKIYSEAALVVPDGISLVYASRLLGKALKGRVTGVDVLQGLCGRAAERGLRVFFLGGRRGAAEEAAARLQSLYPGLTVAGTSCPPWGFHLREEGLNEVSQAILAARPQILFVALGAPKQEYWIYEHGSKLGVPLSIGVGGSFEMISGMIRRAPKWIQAAGLEWLFRLAIEPRRLWKRYLIGNAQFLGILLRQAFGRREGSDVERSKAAGTI